MKHLSFFRKIFRRMDEAALKNLYLKHLQRKPHQEETTPYLRGQGARLTRAQIEFSILNSRECRELIVPLCEEIRTNYTNFLLREPTEKEIRHHVNFARNSCGNDDALRAAISAGVVRGSLGLRTINLEMDITNHCQLRCVMCAFSHPSQYKRKPLFMPVEVFERLAKRLFHVIHFLSLSYGSESLLHPNFAEIINIASQYKIPRIYLNTNGLLLTEEHVETMVKTGFHGISVSIDAATRETYTKIRIGGDFDRLLENIRMVEAVKKRMGATDPIVSLIFVMMHSNIHELPDLVDLAYELNTAGINATHMIPFKLLNNSDQTAAKDKALCNAMLAEARRRAEACGLPFVAPREFDLENKASVDRAGPVQQRFGLNVDNEWERKYSCPFPWHFLAIHSSGSVFPCGWWFDQEAMGNLYEEDILSIWQNARYQALRSELAASEPRETCRNCPAAGMGNPDHESAFICH